MNKWLLFSFVIFVTGCSGTGNDANQQNEDSITGVWFSDCVETSALPFPPTPAAYNLNGYVTVELNFENGRVTAEGTLHDNSDCSDNTGASILFFDGTYSVGETSISTTDGEVKIIQLTGDDEVFLVSYDYQSYYIIDNGILYMNDLFSNELNIQKAVPYSR